jgi:methylthioribose-1-phosphate isomerase
MGERAAGFLEGGILTHCNTGGLATAGIGTALGAIRTAFESGKKIHVFVDETRPLWQGSRLTAWELGRLGIPFTLICDGMAASLMASGRVQSAIVGADRIAVNGDVANKIGTYSLAVNAHYHRIPFYVVAPSTTLDPNCPTGKEIPIEERSAEEVQAGKSPGGVSVWNPAFDITPRALITKIILENRIF